MRPWMDTRRDQAVEIYHFKAVRKALLVDWPEQAVEKWIGVDEVLEKIYAGPAP